MLVVASCYLQVRFAGLDEFPGFFYQVTCLLERDLRAHTVVTYIPGVLSVDQASMTGYDCLIDANSV